MCEPTVKPPTVTENIHAFEVTGRLMFEHAVSARLSDFRTCNCHWHPWLSWRSRRLVVQQIDLHAREWDVDRFVHAIAVCVVPHLAADAGRQFFAEIVINAGVETVPSVILLSRSMPPCKPTATPSTVPGTYPAVFNTLYVPGLRPWEDVCAVIRSRLLADQHDQLIAGQLRRGRHPVITAAPDRQASPTRRATAVTAATPVTDRYPSAPDYNTLRAGGRMSTAAPVP